METIEKPNIACVVEYNGKHYLKNIINGCTIEFNDQYYTDFESRKEYVLEELDGLGFFRVHKSNTIDLMIMLSSSCNLSCSYCFEKNKKERKIQSETIAYIISFLKNNLSASTSTLNITFTGGEPLTASSKMYCLTDKIKHLCEQMGVPVNFSIITNGTLIDDEIMAFFNANNFEVQITLDGQRELHNQIRHFNDHTGTFDSILSNIDRIHSEYRNVHITVRVNISKPDFEVYIPLFEELWRRFPRFDVYIDFLDVARSSEVYMNDFQKIDFYSKFLLLMKKHDRFRVRNYFEGGNCMIRNNSSLTIDSDGRIYKCYSLVGNNLYECGSICDLVDCQVSTIPPMVKPCNNTGCVFYHLCYGGCPYKRYVVDNALDSFCKYDFIKKMNAYIFVTDIVCDEDIEEIKRLVDHVEYFQINIK